ncbi:MAG: S8 family serine peptidase [Candidatus Wallbacteria bacterium]|nr:S8 family serine peptidase [Candidatus Wallbacteria bacterium]
MKRVLLVVLLVFFQILFAASSNVIVFLKDATDISSIQLSPDLSNRPQIIALLKRNADQAQQSFMMGIDGRRGITVTELLWSINAAVVTCGNDADQEYLASLPSVASVLPDLLEFPEKTVESRKSVESESDDCTYGLKNMNVPRVWQELGVTGAGVTVGIIDTGIDGNHPELQSKIVKWFDVGGSVTPADSNGHGSHVAGTICGGKLSGTSIGVAPDANLIIVRGISSKGTRASDLLLCMEWIIDPDQNPQTSDFPRVVSCSWTSGYGDQNPYYTMIQRWIDLGMVPNFSAGNSGPSASTITAPKEFPGCFASAAVDSSKTIAGFSSRGPGKYQGRDTAKPDWASPGVDVYSVKTGGGYTTKSGTSMAAPHTAGVIALMLQVKPLMSVEDIRQVLTVASQDAGAAGYDYTYGHGCLDAYQAVSLTLSAGSVTGVVRGPSGPLTARVTAVENGRSTLCDSDGRFMLMLPEGSYSLSIAMFGHTTVQVPARVTKGQETTVNVSLSESAKIKISGRVISEETLSAISDATVLLTGSNGTKARTDASGRYEIQIAAGAYGFEVSCFGYETLICPEQSFNSSGTRDFTLKGLPPVLLVDDDLGKDFEKYYAAALQAAGVKFNTYSVKDKGVPSAGDILPYHVIVWFTGSDTATTLTDAEQAAVKSYLESGGNLLISGQDIGYNCNGKPFMNDWLHAGYIKDKADILDIEGNGLEFSISGGDGADNQKYPDVIEARNGGENLFLYKNGKGTAAVKYNGTHRVAYLGFGFEAVSGSDSRNAVMNLLIGNLYPDALRCLDRIRMISTGRFADILISRPGIMEAYQRLVADEFNRLPMTDKVHLLQEIHARGLTGTVIHEALLN